MALTPYSWKIVTTANTSFNMPFECPPVAIWCDTVGSSKTATVEGIWGGGALPTDAEIFVELEYLGDGSSPQGSFVNDGTANLLATPAAQTASSATWGGNITQTVWDPTTITNVALSGGNLVATNTVIGTSADQGARVAAGLTTGKYYFEATISGGGVGQNVAVGVGTTASTYTGIGGSATTGVMMYRMSGNIYANGSNSGSSIGSNAAGDIIGTAIDLDNRKIWFKRLTSTPSNWNGNVSANPATNVGGITIPAGTMVPFCTFGGVNGATGSNTWTANFGGSAFFSAAPSGFTGWPTMALPFSLSVPFTAAQKGFVYARVKCAKPSATFYIDPLLVLT